MKKKSSKKLKVVYKSIYDSLSPEEKEMADRNIEVAFDMIFTEALSRLHKKKIDPDLSIVDKK